MFRLQPRDTIIAGQRDWPLFTAPLYMLLVLLLWWPYHSGHAITLDPSNSDARGAWNLSKHLSYLPVSHFPSLPMVRKIAPQQWQSHLGQHPNLATSEQGYWFSTNIETSQTFSGLLVLEQSHQNVLGIYLFADEQLVRHYPANGTEEQSVHLRNLAMPVELNPNSHYRLYLQVRSPNPQLQFAANIWQAADYYQHESQQNQFFGAYFGSLILISLFNIGLFFLVKEAFYLYFAAYTSIFAITTFTLTGFAQQYLWPHSTELDQYALSLLAPAFRLTIYLFTLSFLQVKRHSPKLAKAIYLAMACDVIGLYLSPLGIESSTSLWSFIANHIAYPLVLMTAIYLWYKGVSNAKFFVIAWSVFIIGMVYYNLVMQGVLHYTTATLPLYLTCHWFKTILFSLALAHRINLQKANEKQLRKLSEAHANDMEQLLQLREEAYQQQLEASKAEQKAFRARAESETKSEFLTTISREIHTPMNDILGLAELLQDSSLQPQQHLLLDSISTSGQALVYRIDNIVNYARLEAGNVNLHPSDFHLEDLLDDCVEACTLLSREKRLPLTSIIAPDTPLWLTGDAGRLRQVLLNLLLNAFQFTDRGEICLRVCCLGESKAGCRLRFSVSDTGTGIAPEQQQLLLQRFTQTDVSSPRNQGNNGLGLVICQRLLLMMGGSLDLTSNPGSGSCFSFELSLPHSHNPLHSFSQHNSELPGKRLLLVDEQRAFAEFVRNHALQWQMQVEICHNAMQASELLRRQPGSFDLLLLSEQLPEGDGLKLFERWTRLPELHPLPKLVRLGGYPLETEPSTLEELSNAPRLLKPTTARQLQQAFLATLDAAVTIKTRYPQYPDLQVLVAEHHPINRQVVQQQLLKFGIQAEMAEDGRKALQMAEQRHFAYDLVLAECEMPTLDGFTTSQIILERCLQLNIAPPTIIAVSANIDEEQQQQANQAGMQHYLSKPVSIKDLACSLAEVAEPVS